MLADLCTVDGLREDVNGFGDSWKRCYMETILLKNATSSSNWSSYLEKKSSTDGNYIFTLLTSNCKRSEKKSHESYSVYGSCSVCMYISLKCHKIGLQLKRCIWLSPRHVRVHWASPSIFSGYPFLPCLFLSCYYFTSIDRCTSISVLSALWLHFHVAFSYDISGKLNSWPSKRQLLHSTICHTRGSLHQNGTKRLCV